MTRSMPGRDTPEALLRGAADRERATHCLALFLGVPDDEVRESPIEAMIQALSRFPERRALRRGKDRSVIDAIRVLARELPSTAPRKNHVLIRLSELSRQAAKKDCPEDCWS